MFNLNELCVMAYENAAKREAKDGKVSTDTMQMLKHTATEVVEATEAYTDNEYVDKSQTKAVFASELADIITISFLSNESLTTILIVLITIILSYFTLVFGELIPKKIGLIYSEKIAVNSTADSSVSL